MSPESNASAIAASQFEATVQKNRYPGRGLVIGPASDGSGWLQVYWIMGRSENSRNRRFVAQGGMLRTEPVDPAKVEDPSLIIYEPMLELAGRYIVTNGDQTRTIHDALEVGGTFAGALATREREPDAPNYTPRISGMLDLRPGGATIALSILKANPCDPELTDHTVFEPATPPLGIGVGLTTYEGDGNPLPSFTGDPRVLPIDGTPEAVLERYWDGLDPDNRVSLAVKHVPSHGGASRLVVKNRFGDA